MSTFSMTVPPAIVRALDILSKAGHEGWLVGGCVRDAVMGVEPHDYDITVSSTPEETIAAFSGFRIIETGLKHGTVTVIVDGEPLEMTTFRLEGEYLDNRHPSSVSFSRRLEDDLMRRDFTINAMAYRPDKGLVDPFGGCKDIERGLIRCVGKAAERFSEDGLRILRALRFASRLGFELECETDRAVFSLSHLLCGISAERVYSELCGILVGKNAGSILLRYAEVIARVIPELDEIIGFEQKSKYHCFDVMEHTCWAIDSAVQDRLVRLALLLHDFGKPRACFCGADGYNHYLGHEKISAAMADDVLIRLRADGATRRTVVRLVEMHDRAIVPNERHAKRLLRELSFEEAMLLMEIKIGDRAAHAPGYRDTADIYRMKELLEEIKRRGDCLTVSSLAIGGRELMALGMQPGPDMGALLERLLDKVVNGECENQRDALLLEAERSIRNNGE